MTLALKKYAILIVTLLMGAPSLLYPFARDQAIFAVIGDVWLRGGMPYRDAWDVKPPLIFAIYGLAQGIFGHSMISIRVMDMLCVAVAGYLLLALGKQFKVPSAGFWAGILYPVLYYACWRFPDTAQAESFAAPLTILMFMACYSLRERRNGWVAFGAGICLGLLLLLKTTFALFALPAAVILVWQNSPGWEQFLPGLAGVIVPVGATYAYFNSAGQTELLRELIIAQMRYANVRSGGTPFLQAAAAFATHWPLLIWAALLGVVPLTPKGHRMGAFLFFWALFGALTIAVQHRFLSYHAVVMAAPLAMVGGLGLSEIVEIVGKRMHGLLRPILTVVLIAIPMLLLFPAIFRYGPFIGYIVGTVPRKDYLGKMTGPESFIAYEDEQAGHAAAKVTLPGDPILVIGYQPSIYFVANRDCPTRHLSAEEYLYETQIPVGLRAQWAGELLRDCSRRPPKALVLLAPRFFTYMKNAKDYWPNQISFRRNRYIITDSIGQYRVFKLVPGSVVGLSSVENTYPIFRDAIGSGYARQP